MTEKELRDIIAIDESEPSHFWQRLKMQKRWKPRT